GDLTARRERVLSLVFFFKQKTAYEIGQPHTRSSLPCCWLGPRAYPGGLTSGRATPPRGDAPCFRREQGVSPLDSPTLGVWSGKGTYRMDSCYGGRACWPRTLQRRAPCRGGRRLLF